MKILGNSLIKLKNAKEEESVRERKIFREERDKVKG